MPLGKSLHTILSDYFGEESINLKQLNTNDKAYISVTGLLNVCSIPIHVIETGVYQTRTRFDDEKIKQLASSISKNGLIHPIVVLKRSQLQENGYQYMLLAGERRLRACTMLGFEEIPAVVKLEEELDPAQQALIAAMENLQREDLTPIDLAHTFLMLMKTQNLSEDELATMLGYSTQYIKNYIRLLTLTPSVQEALHEHKIGEGQARHLVGLEPTMQEKLLEVIVTKNLTVKEVAALVRTDIKRKPTTTVNSPHHNMPPAYLIRAQKLANFIEGSRLKCSGDMTKGKIVITWG